MYNTKFIMSDGSIIYPAYLDVQDKEKLRNIQGDKREYLRCGCRPGANLYYRLSDNLKFYPEHNNYEHDRYCCRYRQNGIEQRKTAYRYDDAADEITAFCSFNPKMFNDSDEPESDNMPRDKPAEEGEVQTEAEVVIEKGKPEKGDVAEKKEPKLGLPELIRSLNVDAFSDAVMHGIKLIDRNSFSKAVYHRMSRVRISKMRKTIGELTLENDGVRFIYFSYAETYEQSENGYSKCYIDTVGAEGKHFKNLVSPDALRKAVKAFVKAYGIEPDGNTMIAGFQYLKKSRSGYTYRIIGRLHIFQVSSAGVYSRNLDEMKVYSRLEKIVRDNTDIWYVIPPEDPAVAAIIYMEGKAKSLLLTFRSKHDEVMSYNQAEYALYVVDYPDMITAEYIRKQLI